MPTPTAVLGKTRFEVTCQHEPTWQLHITLTTNSPVAVDVPVKRPIRLSRSRTAMADRETCSL